MNVKRFTARTSRDALILVRQALGEDAVVLSTKPGIEGVEVLAMAPEGMKQIERLAAKVPTVSASPDTIITKPVEEDVAALSMSTLSFQDYVRERMLRRRQAMLNPPAAAPAPAAPSDRTSVLEQRMSERAPAAPVYRDPPTVKREPVIEPVHEPIRESVREPVRESTRAAKPAAHDLHAAAVADAAPQATHAAQIAQAAAARRDQENMMGELRSMKGLIEERFGALAFIEKLNRQPAQARLTQKLFDAGFSPALIRKIGDSLAADTPDETAWAASVLERNLMTAEGEAPLEDQGGVYALVGATGVGKTTTTAKIAAAFAAKFGAANLGLITLDAYRIGAHEQLRAYGRILGVPVHTAHDRASLEDLLDLLAAKKMVLIDTAGMAQRDARTRELLEMLSHRSIQKLLVINSASQGETIEDVMISYQASACAGVVLSKMDEAVKLGPALDALIRHKVKVIGVANGQRVPEDWHRLSANAMVHRALRAAAGSAYKFDANDVSLIFTAQTNASRSSAAAGAQHV